MPTIRIPIHAHFISIQGPSGPVAPGWDKQSLAGVIQVVNQIWRQADLEFDIRSGSFDGPIRLPGPMTTVAVDRAGYFFLASQFRTDSGVCLALVNQVSRGDLAGEASAPLNFCLMPRSTNARVSGRTLAHELGHLLGLHHFDIGHTIDPRTAATYANDSSNLMYSGLLADSQLTAQQIADARRSPLGLRFGGP